MQLWRRLFGKGVDQNRAVRLETQAVGRQTAVAAGMPESSAERRAEARCAPQLSVSGRKPGEVLGGVYPIVRKLGEGGFGEVFLCHHPEWDIEVAVKTPSDTTTAQAGTIADLQREAEEWTGLGLHPYIAYCYCLHPIGDLPLFVVEYAARGTLRDRIAHDNDVVHNLRGNLDLGIQLCHALEHAHSRGLIHRDLKPANILIAEDGAAKLTDFGIAKRGGMIGTAENAAMAAQQSSCAGTPVYMAPEQWSAHIDARTDLFALGVCLYELFCFCRPYKELTAGPRQEPLRPSDLRGRGALPEGLEQLLLRLVVWESVGRPASAQLVREELAAIYRTAFSEASPYADLPDLQLTASGHNNRGVSYHFLGKQAEAEAAFSQALAADPLHPEATYNLGLIRWRRAEITDDYLVTQLERVRSLDYGWRPAYLLGLAHLERRDQKAAVALEEEASAAAPGSLEAKGALAQARAMLDNEASGSIRIFEGQIRWVHSVAWSPDGKLVLSAAGHENISTIHLWEVATGRRLHTLEGHTGFVHSLTFSPDCTQIFSGSHDGTFRVWDVATGRCLRSFRDKYEELHSVAFSTDGRLALSGSSRNKLRLWEMATGLCLRRFYGHTKEVRSVAFSPDGSLALSGSDDKTVRLWEVATGQCVRKFEGHKHAAFSPDGTLVLSGPWGSPRSVAFSPDGSFVLAHGEMLRLWSVETGRCVRTFEGETVVSVAFSPDGERALLGRSNSLSLLQLGSNWNDRSRLHLAKPEPLEDLISNAVRRTKLLAVAEAATIGGRTGEALRAYTELEALPGQRRNPEVVELRRRLAAGCQHGILRSTWPLRVLTGHNDHVASVALSSDGRLALSGSLLRLWDVATGTCLRQFEGHSDHVNSVAFSLDGRLALSGSSDKTLRLWNVATGACLRRFEGHALAVTSVAFYPDGKLALSGSWDCIVRLWDLTTGWCLRNFKGHTKRVVSVAFSPDGNLVLSASADQTLRLWDAAGNCLRLFSINDVNSVAFSSDGRLFVSGGRDNTVRLWDVAAGRCLHSFEGHDGAVTSVAFSCEGDLVLSGSTDQTLRLWQTNSGECIASLRSDGPIRSVALSRDGTLALAAHAPSIQVWHLDWELLERPLGSANQGAACPNRPALAADQKSAPPDRPPLSADQDIAPKAPGRSFVPYVDATNAPQRRIPGKIKLHGPAAFVAMRKVGGLVAECLDLMAPEIKPGVPTSRIDRLAFEFAMDHGALPAILMYRGYPKATCISVNHVVCNGIPNDEPLRDGDIVNVAVMLVLDGWHAKSSRMFSTGVIAARATHLIGVTYEAMMLGISQIGPGSTTGHIGHVIQTYVEEAQHISVVRDFCGHGLGRLLHDEPNIHNFGEPGDGVVLRPGMFFTVQPMISLGYPHVKVLSDGFTVVTCDRSLSAMFEHTVGVTETGSEVFTFSTAELPALSSIRIPSGMLD